MTLLFQRTDSKKDYTIDDIYNEAKPLDIILFNNKNFSLTSSLIKFGTRSDFNHAALVMDSIPTCKDGDSIISDDATKDAPKYLYEFAGVFQPVTYQKLKDKFDKEEFKSICLIRFKKISDITDEEILKKAKNTVIDNFCKREGYSAQDWKELRSKKSVSGEVKYYIFGIIHRAAMACGLIAAIMVYLLLLIIMLLLIFFAVPEYLGSWLLCAIILMLISAAIWLVACCVYNKKIKNPNNKRELCSTYPPNVLKFILFDGENKESEINAFEERWLKGTPTSPQDLYNLGSSKNKEPSSDECKVINFKL